MKTIYDDNFFNKRRCHHRLDLDLPLRLQKRQLLKKLGFSIDSNLQSCRVGDEKIILELIKLYSKSAPFIIIVSEKSTSTLIPPLFLFYSIDKILWRNCLGEKRELTLAETINQISNLSYSTWLEFTYPIWGEGVIAGRLSYKNYNSQIIELQEGIFPSKIMHDHNLAAYSGEINYCNFDLSTYYETKKMLKGLGYESIIDYSVIEDICFSFRGKIEALEKLKAISPMPTLEFAFVEGKLIIIDIDWPESFITIK